MRNGWQTKRLGELAEIELGKTPARANISLWDEKKETSNVWLSIADLLNAKDNVVFDSKEYVSDKGAKICKVVPKGTLLVSFKLTLGRLAFAGRDLHTNEAIAALTLFNEREVSKEYLFWFLQFFDWQKAAEGDVKIKGMTLNKAKLKELSVLFPPLPEQRRIVGILDDAFAGLATATTNAEKNLQNARALFESCLHSEHAEKALLGDLVEIRTGKLDANAAVEGGKYPFFTCSREIFAINDYTFDCEAILLAGNNAVGDFNVKHYKGKFNAYQRTYVITIKEPKRVFCRFLYFQMLKSLKKFKAQSVGAGTKFLKMGMIQGLEIELPSLDEQQRIVSTVDAVREESENLGSIYGRKLKALEDLKKSLLHHAFTGQL
jgi:type I restriction enzyme S subunit